MHQLDPRYGVLLLFALVLTSPVVSSDLDVGEEALLARQNPIYLPKELPEKIRQASAYFSASYDTGEEVCIREESVTQEVREYLDGNKLEITECQRAVGRLLRDRLNQESYAIRMLDSRGRRESGLRTGNHRWWGSYHECQTSYSDEVRGKWCSVGVGFSPDYQYIQVGVCFPDVCDEEEISEIYGNWHLGNLSMLHVATRCPKDLSSYTAVDIVALVICGVLGLLLLSGTAYELTLLIKQWRNVDANASSTYSYEKLSIPARLILAFSIIRNTKTLLDTTQKEGNISALHGLRFISMTWVILGHAFAFSITFLDNIVDMSEYYLTHGEFQSVGNATFSVDSFFFLSGLLVAYLSLRELDKRGTLNVPLMYLNRYLRLTPCLAFVILIAVSLFGKFGDGPLWEAYFTGMKNPCAENWWAAILYINNLYPVDPNTQCIGWVWYLANDMQFYWLSPIFLFLLYLKPIVGVCALGFCILASASSTGAISSVYELFPDALNVAGPLRLVVTYLGADSHILGNGNGTDIFSGDDTAAPTTFVEPEDDYPWHDIYTKPWCRLGAYLIGMSTGYFLHITADGIKMKKWFVVLMWAAVTAVELSIVYGLVGPILGDYYPTVNVAAFYNAVSRPLWAAGLAWVTIACAHGYGGPINGFLSWKVFVPLSRLTYCAYLVHPLVLTYLFANNEHELHYSVMNIVIYYLAALMISCGVAYIVSMSVEAPMVGIQRVIFPRKRVKSEKEPVVISNGFSNDLEMKGGEPSVENGGEKGLGNGTACNGDTEIYLGEKGEKM